MWRELESEAIYIGLDLLYYWQLNPKQLNKHIEVYNRRVDEDIKLQDRLNHVLGMYAMYAFNDPEQYPKEPFFNIDPVEKHEQTAEDMERMARLNTLMLGGTINGSNNHR